MYFQNYNEQDAHKHGEADTGSWWLEVPGAIPARDASRTLIGMYQRKRPFSDVEKFLRNHVYSFAPAAAEAPTGGTAARFNKRDPAEIDWGSGP